MYRNHIVAARYRQKDLSREGGIDTLAPEIRRVGARRLARIWSAGVALASLVAMLFHFAFTIHLETLSAYVVGAWVGGGLAYVVVRLVAPWWLGRRVRRAYATTGDIFFDMGRFEAQHPRDYVLGRAHRLERLSFQLPLVALALVAPLSIHFVVGMLFFDVSFAGFGNWILTSAALVGHAHLILALFGVFHVVRVQRELDAGVHVSGASRGMVALVWTVGASAIPGLVLLCIPPLLVALTGLLFVPWAFQWVSSAALIERTALVEAGLRVDGAAKSI